jgi:endonuclease YncB( thermonuclease family)
MLYRLAAVALAGAAILTAATDASPATAETMDAIVVSFPEGETIVVRDATSMKHEVKLSGIELIEQGQPHFRESRRFLSSLLFSKSVRVEWTRRNNRGWLIGKVSLSPPESRCHEASCPKTMDVGLTLLTGGLAWHKRNDPDQSQEDVARYTAAEEQARARRVGLWADAKPVPPWEWRERTIVRELRRSGPER